MLFLSELGQTLKTAREKKGLTLDDLEEETKIQKRYLQAIENGDYDKLPGHFYSRAFIKSYAEAVGLDFSQLASQFASEMPEVHREAPDIRTMPPDGSEQLRTTRLHGKKSTADSHRNWSSVINAAIIVVVVLIVLMLAYILITGMVSRQAGSSAGSNENGSSIAYSGSSSSHASDSSSSQAGSSSSSTTSPDKQKLKLDKTEGRTSTYTLTGTSKFDVKISSKKGQSGWYQLKDAKAGKTIAQGMVSSSQKSYHYDASGVQSLDIQFGSVPNTELRINGKLFTFPSQNTVQDIVINFSK
ncbi:MAG: helix-turn-helix domain-containing protein [Sporolactobacillus sp.]|nr:helix-turn-helix domain-containing protein [Sporolactobacillus sp.]MCI1882905.1 helix-turn-helix domain-containing protein [Sporolactobacillus sp.]